MNSPQEPADEPLELDEDQASVVEEEKEKGLQRQLLKFQVRNERLKPWTNLVIFLAAVGTAAGLFYQRGQLDLSRRGQTYSEYQAAVDKLGASSPLGRTPGYYSLLTILPEVNDDLEVAATFGLLQSLSLESDDTLRTGVVERIDDDLVATLSDNTRGEAVRFTAHLLRVLSRKTSEADAYARRRGLVRVMGSLLSHGTFSQLDFKYLDLDGLKVEKASMPETDFSGSSLFQVEFLESNLRGSVMGGGRLDASFSQVDLSNVQFGPGTFFPTSFKDSNLTGAMLNHLALVHYNSAGLGWAARGGFAGSTLDGCTLKNPVALLEFAGDPSDDPLIEAAWRHRTDKSKKFRLTRGIDTPTLNVAARQSGSTVLTLPIHTLVRLSDTEPTFREAMRWIGRDVIPQVPEGVGLRIEADQAALDWIENLRDGTFPVAPD